MIFNSWVNINKAQEIKIIFYAGTSQIGDTVQFGYRSNAQIGLDTILGEKNINSLPWSNSEIRILQRNKSNFSCSYQINIGKDTIPIYYSQVFDSKKNFRSTNDTSYTNRLFEVVTTASTSSTWRIIPDRPMNQILDSMIVFADSCLDIHHSRINFKDNSFREYVYNTAGLKFLLFIFKKGVLTQNYDIAHILKEKERVYPNPFLNQIAISNFGSNRIKTIRIYDILGREVFSKKDDFGEQIELNLSHLNHGTFLMVAFDKEIRQLFSRTIVKQ